MALEGGLSGGCLRNLVAAAVSSFWSRMAIEGEREGYGSGTGCYTPGHAMRYFVVSRTLSRQWQKVLEWSLKNKSYESKLLLALLDENDFLLDSCSPFDSWLIFLSSHSNSFRHWCQRVREMTKSHAACKGVYHPVGGGGGNIPRPRPAIWGKALCEGLPLCSDNWLERHCI